MFISPSSYICFYISCRFYTGMHYTESSLTLDICIAEIQLRALLREVQIRFSNPWIILFKSPCAKLREMDCSHKTHLLVLEKTH